MPLIKIYYWITLNTSNIHHSVQYCDIPIVIVKDLLLKKPTLFEIVNYFHNNSMSVAGKRMIRLNLNICADEL